MYGDDYIDEIEKIKYYKERIANQLARTGVYPDDAKVQAQLDHIDTRLSILQFKLCEEGEHLDLEQFNENFVCIYNDLSILYRVTYELAVRKFQQIKTKAETHLAEFESLALKYERKNRIESGSTSLGKTVFFQGSGFEMTENNGIARLDLGTLTLTQGAKIACIFESDTVSYGEAVFHIGDMTCTPYSLNHDFITIPGTPSIKKYTYTPKDDVRTSKMRQLLASGLEANPNNRYFVFAGKDKVEATQDSATAYVDHNEAALMEFTGTGIGKMQFYVLNGTYVDFTFSKQPLSKNFAGTRAEDISKYQLITIEYEGDFYCSFTTNGDVYAVAHEGAINESSLCYPGTEDLSDFYIEEYSMESTKTYSAYLEINTPPSIRPRISTVAIKELPIIDEVDL